MIAHPPPAQKQSAATSTLSRQGQTNSDNKIIRLPRRGNDNGGRRTLVDEMTEFILSRRAMNCTPPTLSWYERCLGKLHTYMEENELHSVRQIKPSTLRRFLVQLAEAGHSPGGVATLFTGVRAFLNWCKSEYALTDWEPLAGIKAPKRPKDPLQPVSLEDVQAIADACTSGKFTGDRDRAILYFLLDSGLRHQEMTNLLVKDVDLKTGRVHVRWGKGRKTRTVFIGRRACAYLAEYLAYRPGVREYEPLWIKASGDGLSMDGIRQVVRRRAKQAGVPEPGIHSFRRAYAINCLRNGMDVVTLQRLMGHEDQETIHRYLAQVDDDLRLAHNRYGVVDKMMGDGE